MLNTQFVNYSVVDGVATIALNSPDSLNALHQEMRIEIIALVEKAENDSNVRVVILTGEGRCFSAGADLAEGLSSSSTGSVTKGHASFVEQCAAEYSPWLMGIHNSSKLYIAAVNGVAAGISSAAVMNCDLIIMADDAYLYQAFSAIGLMPDGGVTWQLLKRVGYHKAIELAVDAGTLTAQQCLEFGIANKVVPAESLREEAHAWAASLAQGAPLAQTAVKSLMRKAHEMSYKEVLDQEAILQSNLLNSEDSLAGVKAFFAKEKPVFNGK